jgi:hypothetical protein
LRVLVYESDKIAFKQFCRWSGQSVPSPDSVFSEQPDSLRVVRDLSTVEELEMALTMSRYTLQLLEVPEKLTQDQICLLMETYGRHLRATFIAKHRYQPEDSRTPYVPVTVDGLKIIMHIMQKSIRHSEGTEGMFSSTYAKNQCH